MSNKQIVSIATSGDPRRPHEVYPYQPAAVDPEQPPEAMMLLATVVGLAGLWLKVKVMSWASLLMIISSIATMKSSSADMRQTVMTLMFAVMGMVMSYLKPLAVAKNPAAAGFGGLFGAGRASSPSSSGGDGLAPPML